MKKHSIAIAALISIISGIFALDGYSAQVTNSSQIILAQTDISPTAVTPQQAIARLLNAQKPKAEWFTPEFLAKIPLSQIEQIIIDK
ncbi:hypothetical protein APA_2753 [Pseudanabaena sp. lw0831]|uniref:hypothetical protein n=1 Tax=Pseudanabaena sp. lw0831 TaxID=1357935 RepID=UPI00191606B7|nr:hypothetical protein [Pseudanabaena sp. lw0831]GBO54702.1 hypothetical protein APA_2753 [Pseudanabaena sp. lw0831]